MHCASMPEATSLVCHAGLACALCMHGHCSMAGLEQGEFCWADCTPGNICCSAGAQLGLAPSILQSAQAGHGSCGEHRHVLWWLIDVVSYSCALILRNCLQRCCAQQLPQPSCLVKWTPQQAISWLLTLSGSPMPPLSQPGSGMPTLVLGALLSSRCSLAPPKRRRSSGICSSDPATGCLTREQWALGPVACIERNGFKVRGPQ